MDSNLLWYPHILYSNNICEILLYNWQLVVITYQSINQSNPVLLKERVRIPRTRRAGGAAMLWRRLPLDGVGSCRLFFTDDLHDNLSWVPASDKPHTFKSCFTHSSQVFFGRPGPFLPGTGLDLTLFISPLERMTCPNHLLWANIHCSGCYGTKSLWNRTIWLWFHFNSYGMG